MVLASRFSGKRVTLGITGGIAAYKIPELVRLLIKEGIVVFPVMTKKAADFVTPLVLETLCQNRVLKNDSLTHQTLEISHIDRAQNVEAIVIAPATANTIAKMAHGIADNILTEICLAADPKKVIVSPAMNAAMWEHAATKENIRKLVSFGISFVWPIEGELACGTLGIGKLALIEDIVEQIFYALAKKDMKGVSVCVTAGPTREYIDKVRFLSNPSTGRMGIALAREFWLRGANVKLILGPSALSVSPGIEVISITNALEMLDSLKKIIPDVDVLVMNAAITDFRPSSFVPKKLKKVDMPTTLLLDRNPDILKTLSRQKKERQVFVGFAAEADGGRVIEHAKKKMEEKGLDIIVANDVSGTEVGFTSRFNSGFIVIKGKEPKEVPKVTKEVMAIQVVDEVALLLRRVRSEHFEPAV